MYYLEIIDTGYKNSSKVFQKLPLAQSAWVSYHTL